MTKRTNLELIPWAVACPALAWVAPGDFTVSSVLWTGVLLTPWIVVGPIWLGALKAAASAAWAEWKLIRKERAHREYGGHSPKNITSNPKAWNVPKGPAPGASVERAALRHPDVQIGIRQALNGDVVKRQRPPLNEEAGS